MTAAKMVPRELTADMIEAGKLAWPHSIPLFQIWSAMYDAAPAPEAMPMWWRDPLQLALTFHNLYEQFAPRFGYETRTETRRFDPESANGQLMQTVCASIIAGIDAAPSAPAAEPPPDVAGLVARLRKIIAIPIAADSCGRKLVTEATLREVATALEAMARENARLIAIHAELYEEQVDWARRFKLNDVTPWEWMTRAKRGDSSDAAWRILCNGKQKIIERAERDLAAARERIKELELECASYKTAQQAEDAERYRWLRVEGGSTFSWDEWRNLADLSASELDAAIDAARAGKGE